MPEHPARFSGRGLTGCLWRTAHFFQVKISIHTDGLKNLSPFGLDVFHKSMSPLDDRSRKIVFTRGVQGVSSVKNNLNVKK
jgi:hypothetical protein